MIQGYWLKDFIEVCAALKLAITMLSFFLVVFTTPPKDTSSVRKMDVPRTTTLMITLSFRFILTLYLEALRVISAMKARGQIYLDEVVLAKD